MTHASLETALCGIKLPVPLSDSTHGTLTHFELVTVRLRDSDGAEGNAMAPARPGHGVEFDWVALRKTGA